MSTTPADAWHDAGLEEPDETTSLLDEATTSRPDGDGEEYLPGVPRPDLDGSANEADVVEQAAEVPVEPEDPAYG